MNQPTPKPLKVYHLTTYGDDNNRVIIERRPIQKGEIFTKLGDPEYLGQSIAAVIVRHPQTGQPVQQEVQFQFEIPAKTIHEAFELFHQHEEPGFHKHMEKMKVAALKQGADLSQLPKTIKG